jgi:hypothetical protein
MAEPGVREERGAKSAICMYGVIDTRSILPCLTPHVSDCLHALCVHDIYSMSNYSIGIYIFVSHTYM